MCELCCMHACPLCSHKLQYELPATSVTWCQRFKARIGRRPSSVNFSLKSFGFGWIVLNDLVESSWRSNFGPFFHLEAFFSKTEITFALRHVASQWGYCWTAKRWIWLNRSKGNFARSESSENVKFLYFSTFWQFYQKRSDNCFCLYSFLLMVLIICQEIWLN